MVDQFTSAQLTDSDSNAYYWSSRSQAYAPADVLVRHLQHGWRLDPLAAVESFWHAGVRRVDVYYFTLNCDDQRIEMPVLANPTVFRLIEQYKLTVIRVNATPIE